MTTRRAAISLATITSVGALSACGGSEDGSGDAPVEGGDTGQGPVKVPVTEVPEGGGIVRDRVVVTQPEAGTFKAFDATCPHQGCAVSSVTSSAIICPCHGSQFDPTTGDVTQGPATTGLTVLTATVEGQDVTVS